MKYANLDEVREAVREHGNILTFTAGELRDAYGEQRLGVRVRASITRELTQRGMAHTPTELPDRQDRRVRVYIKGTFAADLIEAALNDPSAEGDEVIREATSGEEKELLSKVREIVCG